MKKSNNSLQGISNDTKIPVDITCVDIGNATTKTDKGVSFPLKTYETRSKSNIRNANDMTEWSGMNEKE